MIYYILLTVEHLRCLLAPDGSCSRKALYSGFEIARICELQIDLVPVNYLPSCSNIYCSFPWAKKLSGSTLGSAKLAGKTLLDC